MNDENSLVTVRVWGDFACFTRPEMKVERASYPVCTPSAARGILEAIFWEPQMYYVVDSIAVVKKGHWFSFRRNEVTKVVSIADADKWMRGTKAVGYIQAGAGAPDLAQRNMLALADVEYIISAEVNLSGLHKTNGHTLKTYCTEIKRRASNGKCHYRPVLGCREFAADFDWVEPGTSVKLTDWAEDDLGLMLYDVFDVSKRAQGFRWLRPEEIEHAEGNTKGDSPQNATPRRGKKAVSQDIQRHEGLAIEPQAVFFHAKIKDACMDCNPGRVRLIRPGAGGDV